MLLAQCVLCFMRLALVANAYARLEVRNRLKAAVHRRTWIVCDKMGKFIGRVHDTVKVFHKRLNRMMEDSSIQQSR